MPQPAWICDLGRVPYRPAARLQRSLRAAREAGAVPDLMLVLEHEPVITTGHRTEEREIAYARTLGLPVEPTERGGKATFHGPGQIVVYPVFDLREHGEDVRRFVRKLEQSLIDTLDEFELVADRRDDYPGVWVGDRKIASVGIRVTRWVSFHGIALNVDVDLAPFGCFTPCGIDGVTMTNMATELGPEAPSVAAVREALLSCVCRSFGLSGRPVDADDVAVIAAKFPVPEPSLKLPGGDAPAAASADHGGHRLVVEPAR